MKALERIAQNVTAGRILAGWTQGELAEKSGVGLSTVQKIEQARAPLPTPRILSKLGKVLGDTVGPHLLNGVAPAESDAPDGITLPPTEAERPPPNYKMRVHATDWNEVEPTPDLDYYGDAEDRRIVEVGIFRITIIGDCMEDNYHDGQTVEFRVLRADEAPIIGAAYVVCRADNTATMKVLVSTSDDAWELAPANQRKYPGSMIVPRQDIVRTARAIKIIADAPPPRVLKIRKPKGRSRHG